MKAPDKIYLHPDDRHWWHEGSKNDERFKEYISKDALVGWVNQEMERLWELIPDADNDNPTKMELRYLGQYMQMEILEDRLNSL